MRRALPDAAAALGTILLALSAWLFLPREREGAESSERPLRVVLVDTSASAVRRHRNWREWVEGRLREQEDAARRSNEDLVWLCFDDEVRRVDDPWSSLPKSWIQAGRASRLANALEVALGLGRAPARVVLLGDGTYTGEDPRPRLRKLAEAGGTLERVDLPPPDVPEVIPGSLSLPDEVEIGAPIAASFDVFYGPGGAPPRSSITLWSGSTPLEVPVPPGLAEDEDGYLVWRVRTEVGRAASGWNPIRITGREEIHPDENASHGVVRGAGARLVAFVARDERLLPAAEGLEVVRVRPGDLAADLDRFDAIVTTDVPSRDLPIEILRSYLERGGGWLAWIGDASLASLPDFLPLQPIAEAPRDVVFVVDRSGSMSGDAIANVRRAVFALMDEALRSDSVELRWFSSRLSAAVPLLAAEDPGRARDREEERRQAAVRVFSAEIGGGPTALLRSLGELADARSKSDREALVFLLTDGRENTDPDPAASAPLVLDRLRAARARLVVVAAGEDADRELLARLLAPGEELHDAPSLADSGIGELRELFSRELRRDRVREGEGLRILRSGSGSELLSALGDPPTTRRYVLAQAAADAEVLWTSESGDALLGLRRVGLGLTAACAASVETDLVPVLRMLARGHRSSAPSVRLEGGELVVEGLPEDAPADLEARVFGEGEAPFAVIGLSPPTEGGDPRRTRRGSWAGSVEALSTLWDEHDRSQVARRLISARCPRVQVRAASRTDWPPIELALAAPKPVEYVLPRPRIPPFESLGVDRVAATARGRESHPAAPWVLLSGMLVLAGGAFAGFAVRAGSAVKGSRDTAETSSTTRPLRRSP